MISIFYQILGLLHNKSIFLEKLITKIFKFILNSVYPLYYKVSGMNRGMGINTSKVRNEKIIISLTTFPSRIKKVWVCIESLLRQSEKPDMVILWLAKPQFPNGEKDLPKQLLLLKKRGLNIRFTEDDMRSHKKYYYVMKEYQDEIIITVDDDTFYPENLVGNLLKKSCENPNSIIANRAWPMAFNEADELYPCNEWRKFAVVDGIKKNHFVQVGVNGVLYPPRSIDGDIAFDKDLIRKLCPLADDLWLNAMATLNNKNVIEGIPYDRSVIFLEIFGTAKFGLTKVNVGRNKNQEQLEMLIKYFPKYLQTIKKKVALILNDL
ncbi:hypothetical protein [Fictibacillus enclensis]|uniref:hypothetical protein n=1 Tax=Fictibacillus enclensis TaxID=1017270 RepID=UPI0024BF28D4|nr:hypothetical protein [Fictibacillus enclensis]WHY71991.1 hypothetical protein QNH15_23860 [Fictibacillus enclensis]